MLLMIFLSNKDKNEIRNVKHNNFIVFTNNYRKSKNLNSLNYNNKLEDASKIQTLYNYNNNTCVHYNDEYPTLKDRLVVVDIEDVLCYSENIIVIRNIKTLANVEKRIFDEYIKSESHRKNMLLECVNSIGFYTIYDGKDVYSTVVFCN